MKNSKAEALKTKIGKSKPTSEHYAKSSMSYAKKGSRKREKQDKEWDSFWRHV